MNKSAKVVLNWLLSCTLYVSATKLVGINVTLCCGFSLTKEATMTATPIYRAFALGIFRSSVFFICAVIAFSQREDRTGTILVTLVFLIDVASYHILQVITISTEGVYTRVWRDTLTNRLFYERLFEKFRTANM